MSTTDLTFRKIDEREQNDIQGCANYLFHQCPNKIQSVHTTLNFQTQERILTESIGASINTSSENLWTEFLNQTIDFFSQDQLIDQRSNQSLNTWNNMWVSKVRKVILRFEMKKFGQFLKEEFHPSPLKIFKWNCEGSFWSSYASWFLPLGYWVGQSDEENTPLRDRDHLRSDPHEFPGFLN